MWKGVQIQLLQECSLEYHHHSTRLTGDQIGKFELWWRRKPNWWQFLGLQREEIFNAQDSNWIIFRWNVNQWPYHQGNISIIHERKLDWRARVRRHCPHRMCDWRSKDDRLQQPNNLGWNEIGSISATSLKSIHYIINTFQTIVH